MLAEVIIKRIEAFKCSSSEEYEAALLEIIQEIALLGLWRSKFFDKAAFYGGTALRILYGLDRFSEDLDFSLLEKNLEIDLEPYKNAVVRELHSLGFEVTVTEIKKTADSVVKSAFIKDNTKEHFIRIGLSERDQARVHANRVLKVKFEIDVDPPLNFINESRPMRFPGPFSVNSMSLPDLFAGKFHALLFRNYKGWVKGRDWYDFLWFLGQNIPVRLTHLQERMWQLGHLPRSQTLTKEKIRELLDLRIKQLDVNAAKTDVSRFLKDHWKIEHWSQEYFHESAQHLNIIE